MSDISKRAEELKKLLAYHDKLYFILDKCEISDSEYDLLKQEYLNILQNHPEFGEGNVLEADINESKLTLIPLNRNMLSLSKVLNKEQLNNWLDKKGLNLNDLIKEYKLDGLGIEINYDKGILIGINTRGDGFIGESILPNKHLLNNVPFEIAYKNPVTIRGEAYLTFANFQTLNEVTDGKYSDPRNAAAGLLRSINKQNSDFNNIVSFNAYEFIDDSMEFNTYTEKMDKLFELTGISKAPSITDEVLEKDIRSDEFPVDGVVLKVNNIKEQLKLGVNNHSPNWAIAYKFPPLGAISKVREVIFTTGKTGKITPVAFYNPVRIGNVICNKASLHNYGILKRFKLREGSAILINRNGDVIPQVANVIEYGDGNEIFVPELCPSCGSALIISKGADGVEEAFCTNSSSCPAQLFSRLYVAYGKHGLDIKGLGKVLIAKLVEELGVSNFADIFTLTIEQLTVITNSSKLADKIYQNIQLAKTKPLNRFIVAMNICGIGETLARTIASKAGSLNDLPKLLTDMDKLLALPDIGLTTAMEIVEFSKGDEFKEALDILTKHTTPLTIDDPKSLVEIAVTGKLTLPRDELAEKLKVHGILLKSTVTNNSKALLVGIKPTNAKLEKANRLRIPIIELPENVNDSFNTLLNEINSVI